MSKLILRVSVFLFLIINLTTLKALAYVDPGSTGHLFQILFVFFSAGIAALASGKTKLLHILASPFRAIKKLFTRKNQK